MFRFDLTGKVAIVTGGATGIGVEYCTTLTEQGCDLAVFDVDMESAQQTAARLGQATGRHVSAYRCNVADEQEVQSAVASVVKDFGKVDILVNNAGILRYSDKLEDWNSVIAVNLTGTWLMGREVIRQSMQENRRGRIVNISSISATLVSGSGAPSYSVSKAGVIALTKDQATAYAGQGILVNAIAPGAMSHGGQGRQSALASNEDTFKKGRHPMKRKGQYGELSAVLLMLVSDENTYVNGQCIMVDGGWSNVL
ncbi:MAG: SDR family NAD(P)-dependent oxidoreductase [Oscillospiraceae bacterium]